MISEMVFEDFLEANLEVIEPGLKLIQRQFKIYKHCKLDLLCEDEEGSLVILELKTYASLSTISQINSYKKDIAQTFPERNARFILVCLDNNKEIPNLCKKENIKFLKIKSKRIPKAGDFRDLPWKYRQIIDMFLYRNSFMAMNRYSLAPELDMSKEELDSVIEIINRETNLKIKRIPTEVIKDIRYVLEL